MHFLLWVSVYFYGTILLPASSERPSQKRSLALSPATSYPSFHSCALIASSFYVWVCLGKKRPNRFSNQLQFLCLTRHNSFPTRPVPQIHHAKKTVLNCRTVRTVRCPQLQFKAEANSARTASLLLSLLNQQLSSSKCLLRLYQPNRDPELPTSVSMKLHGMIIEC